MKASSTVTIISKDCVKVSRSIKFEVWLDYRIKISIEEVSLLDQIKNTLKANYNFIWLLVQTKQTFYKPKQLIFGNKTS